LRIGIFNYSNGNVFRWQVSSAVAVTQIVAAALSSASTFGSTFLWGFCLHSPNTLSRGAIAMVAD
jgi:hypothetical protein